METTFITIHDITLDARLLYVSQSIEDILGYRPEEVTGKSCWEFFHPDEIPFAQAVHGRTIQLDKAANLHYCRVKNKQGKWLACECVFTVVYDVLVASTSIYRRGPKSQKRAQAAPVIRQLFSSSPRDPRYHMLQYISTKFSQKIEPKEHEPRAAMFLNRFSRTLTIMYATNGLSGLLGIDSNCLIGKSFYYCIQENCLREGVKCLESAKANDSIAYLRFWFRDPRQDDFRDTDERMSDVHSSADEDDGGVHLAELMDARGDEQAVTSQSSNSMRSSAEREGHNGHGPSPDPNSRSSSGDSSDVNGNHHNGLFDRPENQPSRTSSVSTPDGSGINGQSSSQSQLELEAVVSCTSDGLVVILRKARPLVPQLTNAAAAPSRQSYQNGLFASPWASEPILPRLETGAGSPAMDVGYNQSLLHPTAIQAHQQATQTGPPVQAFMSTIREVAAFAWALTGINGSLAQYGHGSALGESQPPRLQVWDPQSNAGAEYFWRSAPLLQPAPPPPYKQANSQASAGAVIPRTTYSYMTGLPEGSYYSGSEPMQIDGQTNGSSHGSAVDGQARYASNSIAVSSFR